MNSSIHKQLISKLNFFLSQVVHNKKQTCSKLSYIYAHPLVFILKVYSNNTENT